MVEKFRFWHWMIIGILVGVAYGAVRANFRDEDPPQVRTFDRGQFESHLRQGMLIKDLVLHPPIDGQEWLSGQVYQRDNGSFTMPFRGGTRNRLARLLRRTATSQPAQQQQAQPEAAAAPPPLPPGKWVELQMLAAEPTRNDRNYKTPADAKTYLAELQKSFPNTSDSERNLNYRFAWWEVPRITMALYGGAGFVIVGVIWPAIISLITGAGFSLRREEAGVDLSKVKPRAAAETKAADHSQEDLELAELNAKLEAGVSDMMRTSTDPHIDHDAEHAAAVKNLETRNLDATEAVATKPEEKKDYQGEFYPVAKPGTPKNGKH